MEEPVDWDASSTLDDLVGGHGGGQAPLSGRLKANFTWRSDAVVPLSPLRQDGDLEGTATAFSATAITTT